MPFENALARIKTGERLTRTGWNGKDMFVYLQAGSIFRKGQGRNVHLAQMEGDIIVNPHSDMKAADGHIVIGWLASQTDMLAHDWDIYRPAGIP
jgi:hypothetical protein